MQIEQTQDCQLVIRNIATLKRGTTPPFYTLADDASATLKINTKLYTSIDYDINPVPKPFGDGKKFLVGLNLKRQNLILISSLRNGK